MKKEHFHYASADLKTSIHAICWEPDTPPKGIVQIAHGMVEHIERYDDFARFLVAQQFVVVGNDHLGHGKSVTSEKEFGYFGDTKGMQKIVTDMYTLTSMTKKRFPNVPYILFGHSMGSFLTRKYLLSYSTALQGVIICGTSYKPNSLLVAGKQAIVAFATLRGWRHRSPAIDKLVYGGMNYNFQPERTSKDWLTRDTRQVDIYQQDPLCNFMFTLNGYYNLLDFMQQTQKSKSLCEMQKELPVLFIAGDQDPVGDQGKGVKKVEALFKQTGMRDVTCILYPNYRHEVLNEIGNDIVYRDVFDWIQRVV